MNGGTRSGWFLRVPICCLECFFPGLAKAHHPKHISDHFANSEAFGCWFAWLLAHVTCPSPTALGLLDGFIDGHAVHLPLRARNPEAGAERESLRANFRGVSMTVAGWGSVSTKKLH